MLDACSVSEKPWSQNVSEALLHPLPETLAITIQAANRLKEKQRPLKKLSREHESNGTMQSSHQTCTPSQTLSHAPEYKDLGECAQ